MSNKKSKKNTSRASKDDHVKKGKATNMHEETDGMTELPSDRLAKRHQSNQNVTYITIEETDTGETIIKSEESDEEILVEKEEVKETKEPKEPKELPKSQSYADKLPKMKQKRRKKLNRRLATILTIFGVSALALIYYVSPFSKLGAVKVQGVKTIPPERIVETSGYKLGDSVWSQYYTEQPLKNIVKRNPRVASVTKSFSGVNHIVLHVKEQDEIAYEKRSDGYYPLFKDGRVANEKTDNPDSHYPVLIDFSDKKYVQKMMMSYDTFSEEVKENIKEIYYAPSKANEYRISIIMHDGNEIIGSMTDIENKINYYPQVAQQMAEMGIVDMEAGIYSYSYETRDEYEKQQQKIKEARERGDADLDLEGSEEINFDEILNLDGNQEENENENADVE